MRRIVWILLAPIQMSVLFTACGGGSAFTSVAKAQDSGESVTASNSNGTNGNSNQAITACRSNEPGSYCLALRYVVYKDSSNNVVTHENDAINNINQINQLWKACGIRFEIEKFEAVEPVNYGLSYGPSNASELTSIRKSFADPSQMLVVTTGTWDRTGTLGNTGANAWTAMPGEKPYGAILEKPVGKFANIIAHELGHYVGLDHVSDKENLMNPIIYDGSVALSSDQCNSAKSTINSYWQGMVRS